MSFFSTQVKNVFRFAITIPDNTGTGSTLMSLLQTAGYTGSSVSAIIIDGIQPGTGGTQRAAFLVANPRPGASIAAADFTTHGQYVAAGQVYYTPAEADVSLSYVRSNSASTATATAIVLL